MTLTLIKRIKSSSSQAYLFFYDNNGTILFANNPEFYTKTKLIDMQIHQIKKIIKIR